MNGLRKPGEQQRVAPPRVPQASAQASEGTDRQAENVWPKDVFTGTQQDGRVFSGKPSSSLLPDTSHAKHILGHSGWDGAVEERIWGPPKKGSQPRADVLAFPSAGPETIRRSQWRDDISIP